MEEEWKDVIGFEGYYQVSNMGHVRSIDRVKCDGIRMNGRIKKTHYDACGYEMVQLRKDGEIKHFSVHRLVAIAFLPNPNELPQVNHKDEVRNHNTVDNLEWCTVAYNQNYGNRRRRASDNSKGEKNSRAILKEKDVKIIRESYIPGDKQFGIQALADKYGVKYVTIQKVVQKRIWRYI